MILAACLVVTIGCCALTSERIGGWLNCAISSGDNGDYARVAAAIRTGNMTSVTPKHFWGFPAAVAVVSWISGASVETALVALSLIASVAAAFLVLRLFGLGAALFFTCASMPWIQRSALGGAEPLFILLILAGIAAQRAGRFTTSALLGAFAATVRPVGIFWTVAVVAVLLLRRRDWKSASAAAGLSALVLAAYATLFWIVFRDPMANAHWYGAAFGRHGPIDLPFAAIYQGLSAAPFGLDLVVVPWMLAVLVTVAWATWRWRSGSGGLELRTGELVYLWLASAFLFAYASPEWSFIEFPRFSIAVLPFVGLAVSSVVRLPAAAYLALGVPVSVVGATWAVNVHLEQLLR